MNYQFIIMCFWYTRRSTWFIDLKVTGVKLNLKQIQVCLDESKGMTRQIFELGLAVLSLKKFNNPVARPIDHYMDLKFNVSLVSSIGFRSIGHFYYG